MTAEHIFANLVIPALVGFVVTCLCSDLQVKKSTTIIASAIFGCLAAAVSRYFLPN